MASSDAYLSMFHRRLLLLLGGAGLGFAALGAQMARLTLMMGTDLRDRAESRLVSEQWLSTARGRILDRKGRVLAHDRPSFSLVADYDAVSGLWAERRGLAAARKSFGRLWTTLDEGQREAAAQPFLAAYRAHLTQAWDAAATIAHRSPREIDARRGEIVQFVDRLSTSVKRRRVMQEIESRLERGREITTQFEEDMSRKIGRQSIAEQSAPHVILRSLDDKAGFEFLALAGQRVTIEVPLPFGTAIWREEVDRLAGLRVTDSGDREYPYESMAVEVNRRTLPPPVRTDDMVTLNVEGVATHILGWMRDRVQREDIEARWALLRDDEVARVQATATNVQGRSVDRGQYQATDTVGHVGLERSLEPTLRGLRGLHSWRLDTDEHKRVEAVAGSDVHLSLDIMLQARVQAAMSPELGLARVQPWHRPAGEPASEHMPDGTPLLGAAVVLDVQTGQVLAMASTPSFTRRELREDPDAIYRDPIRTPLLNRAIGKPYQPGSIVKALVLCSAVKFGKLDLSQPIDCTGHLYPNLPDQFRCWIFKNPQFHTTHNAVLGHGLSGVEALMVSCNIYFYTLGQRLGPAGIAQTYRLFGLTEPSGLNLEGEYRGIAGQDPQGAGLTMGDAVFMGIGQGPVAWTPLHAADSFATIARGGIRIHPSLITQVGDTLAPASPRADLQLDPRAIREALQGLWQAVNDGMGTGHHISVGDERYPHFDVPGVDVWGKTGTADASPIVLDGRVIADGDHSWFVVLAGKHGHMPRYAVAVVMEYAGSGGKVSGPIVNQILHALRVEGYFE